MSPQPSIAHYRIMSKLGEGGMGEVWRATDTKLNREVAVKILPEALAQDADRLTRFAREAQVLASLNHPNIAAIYGVEERALVMELVEGITLAERIAQGPISVEDALPILDQLIEALEYAHEKNVIHRDLKPANIKITPQARVKILDFGLAKAITSESAAGDPASSPTLTMRATIAGTIMGTAAYMSPEQARGHEVDKRADIWAFGVVVYEMTTRRPLFQRPTVPDTLASVLREEPVLDVPPPLRKLLRLCLVKDPARRLRDIGDARLLLEEPTAAPARVARHARGPWFLIAATLVLISVALAVALWRATRPVEYPLLRFSTDLGPDAITGFLTPPALSPNGSRMAFASRGADGSRRLSIQVLNQPKAMPLPGTEGATQPFFSPDSQWIGFFADDKLKKIQV